jgi:Protein of unknown function (DUF2934)
MIAVANPIALRGRGAQCEVREAPAKVNRETMIQEAAYFRAERRGFAHGGELDDWLAAEAEIERTLAAPAQNPAPVSVPKARPAR